MRAVVQRVSQARVVVDDEEAEPASTAAVAGQKAQTEVGRIGLGLLVLVGVMEGDVDDDLEWMERKLRTLRVFPDEDGNMNRSIADVGGAMLLVSQFTLAADIGKGARPSFMGAMKPDLAKEMFERLVGLLREPDEAGRRLVVETGRFRAHTRVELTNDGPVTLWLDSRQRSRS